MALFKISRKYRLMTAIAVAVSFFMAELSVGIHTHSLALIADAFHYLSDLVGFVVAYVALVRATTLGAFYNGVFLLALGISILVQASERFMDIREVESPKLVLIVGCVGLGLNVLVMSVLHEHDHGHAHTNGHAHTDNQQHESDHELHQVEGITVTGSDGTIRDVEAGLPSVTSEHREHKHTSSRLRCSGRDLGLLGVLVHVIGDAINNVGVIISALIIWKGSGDGRHYADPAVGVFIAIMIFLTAVPLTLRSGAILLQSAPEGVVLEDVKNDLEKIPGVEAVHELHIWRLNQEKSVASAHIVVDYTTVAGFMEKAKVITECLHAYGIHSATLQPEVRNAVGRHATSISVDTGLSTRGRGGENSQCRIRCDTSCDGTRCCGPDESS